MKAIRLKTEYLSDPIGIDIDRPRLFWNCQGGIKQTAYQIIASNDAGVLLWDSGEVESGSMRTRWGGAPVPARTRVLWKIRLWDENGEPGQWSEAYFETGLPKGEPWRAKWISGDYLRLPICTGGGGRRCLSGRFHRHCRLLRHGANRMV